jgi:hypothetical protein
MTPADEATFIALWQEGTSQQEIAARFGVPVGTIKSRASALARQGRIQARPKGGAYPHQRHQAAIAPVQKHRCRSLHCLPIPQAKQSAGTCGSWMPSGTSSLP